MVYYFSGTGNSGFVAQTLANLLGSDITFIPDFDATNNEMPVERMILVFPVYSWGIPPLIEKFILSVPESHWEFMKERQYPVDCVLTCGDEVGMAPEMIKIIFDRTGMILNSVFSVIMPNNYVLLPGFDVDSKNIEDKKLNECKGRIIEIAQSLIRQDKRIDVIRGSFPWLKTKLIYPLFKKWGIFPSKWKYTPSCIGCGKCAAICPLLNVEMTDSHPKWGKRCCSCLACYHVCPCHAVAYGKETKHKGQYMFPVKKISLRNYHN